MRTFQKSVILAVCFLVLMTLTMCASLNKLQGYEFRDHTAAALLENPPPPEIFTDNWTDVNLDNPVEALIKIGTGIAKEVEVSKTRAKLDSAMDRVDIPEIIRTETLTGGSKFLHYQPIEEQEDAFYLFDMQMKRYGIDAASWSASVHFKMDVKVTLLDNERGVEIWKRNFHESFPVTNRIFGLHDAAGDILNAMALSQLSADQIATGLENLAVHTADRIVRKLREDFSNTRE